MRWLERSGVVSVLAGLGLVGGLAGLPSEAVAYSLNCDSATCFTFEVELGPQREGDFATLGLQGVTVDGQDAVKFTIVLNEDVLGEHASLNEFYFNLPDCFDDDDISVVSSSCKGAEECTLDEGRPTRGGAGARFDFSVSFDADRGDRIQWVSFVVSGVDLEQVLETFNDPSETGRGLEVVFAAHIQGSGHGRGSASATVGVPVPEPGTAALFGLGLAGIALVGRRRS